MNHAMMNSTSTAAARSPVPDRRSHGGGRFMISRTSSLHSAAGGRGTTSGPAAFAAGSGDSEDMAVLEFELIAHQTVIRPGAGDQIVMTAGFHNAALMQDD